MTASSLVNIFCSTTSSKVADQEMTTEPAFLISLFSLSVPFALMPVPQHSTVKKMMVLITRLINQEHLVVYIEGPEPPEEAEQVWAFLVQNLCVSGPLQLIVQVDSKVPVGLDNLHICSIDVGGRGKGFVAPEVHHHILHLLHIQLPAVLYTSTHKSVNQAPVLIIPSVLQTSDYGHVI